MLLLTRIGVLGLTLVVMGHTPPARVDGGFEPKANVTVWPLQMIDGYPFVRGAVGETEGVFMLDTGWGSSLGLNRDRIEMSGMAAGETVVGSGQRMANVVADRIKPLRVAGETWEGLRAIQGSPLGFVEKGIGTPPFLGFIGIGFLASCEMALDYDRRVVVFRRLDRETISTPECPSPEGLPWGKPLATLRYTTQPGLENVPLFEAKLGGHRVRLTLDSGTNMAVLPQTLLKRLESEGHTSEFRDTGDQRTLQISSLEVGGLSFPLQWAVGREGESPAPIGPGDPLIVVGYPFLNRFRTVWNFRDKTVTVYPRLKQ